ncbi:MAG: hypothetical protein CBE03_000435 [Gammaproteobacteria bacterium TMED243]|nr:hypothetical protein [Gammaproteobacteria bacterium]RPG34186.1 MAG: hypothetical protein CBE03_000435 [Gammaproteobacteria bacterium TMED243]
MQRLGRRVKRRIRAGQRVIMQRQELCAHFGIDNDKLEVLLLERELPFHKDSNGQIWASIDAKTTTAGPH